MNKLIQSHKLTPLINHSYSAEQQQEMIIRRNQNIKIDNQAPKYLLELEIKSFFDYVDNYAHLMLFKTLWVTGARISEVLQLKPKSIIKSFDGAILVMPNLKQKIRVKKDA